jgi:hypothetical protein
MSTRLAPLEPPYADATAATLSSMMPPGVPPLLLFRTIAHNPRVLEKIRASNLLDRGSIERRHARGGDPAHHRALRLRVRVGRSRVVLRGEGRTRRCRRSLPTVHGGADDPVWSDTERTLIRLVDELHDTSRVSDALWTGLCRHFHDDQLVELVVLAGFYQTISFVVNGLGVALEPGAPQFPLRSGCRAPLR